MAGRDEILRAYATLGVPEGASLNEIKDAWRASVKVWHPDRIGTDAKLNRIAESRIKEINLAYEMLMAQQSAPKPNELNPLNAAVEQAERITNKGCGCALCLFGILLAVGMIVMLVNSSGQTEMGLDGIWAVLGIIFTGWGIKMFLTPPKGKK